MWYLYIICCSDNSLYTGITNNLSKRMASHNSGKGAKYTQYRTPVALVYQEKFDDRSQASMREASIKKLSRQKKMELISLSCNG